MTDRLPVPGEEGWQVHNHKKRLWVDAEVLMGPIYSEIEYCNATGRMPSMNVTEDKFPIYRIRVDGNFYCTARTNMRRKPEQHDDQAADESFHNLIEKLNQESVSA